MASIILGRSSFCYTGNQVGAFNFTGQDNFVSGGNAENGLSSGRVLEVFFPPSKIRRPYLASGARLDQNLLDSTYPEIELIWVADLTLPNGVNFRLSDRNVYVEDQDGVPRYYEARAEAPGKITRTLGEWLATGFEIGQATFVLDNFDGLFDPFLPNGEQRINWFNSKLEIRVGFGEKFSNYRTLYEGYVTFNKGLVIEDGKIKLKLYEQFQVDQVTIPTRAFNTSYFPFINEEDGGRVPLVYGDWTEEVGDYGQVAARCVNAVDTEAGFFTYKVADNALQEITEVFLVRGEHSLTGSRRPIEVDSGIIERNLEDGSFNIPTDVNSLLQETVIVESEFAESGSSPGIIVSNLNFIDAGIQEGDTILKVSSGERALVTGVTNFQLNISGIPSLVAQDEFRILTRKYAFVSGDECLVKCRGKSVNLTSYQRLTDIEEAFDEPSGVSVDYRGNYWLAEQATQKIYKIRLSDNSIIQEIDYSQIEPNLVDCAGIVIQADQVNLWVLDRGQSRIYFYDTRDNILRTTILTENITGISGAFQDPVGIGIDNLNRLWIADNFEKRIYEINPFPTTAPIVVSSVNYSSVDGSLETLSGISYDLFEDKLALVDTENQTFYRTENDGTIDLAIPFSDIYSDVTDVSAISVAQDSSWFLADRQSEVLYNFLPFGDVSENPGFQAKDLIQTFTSRSYFDFNINWNFIATSNLTEFRSRFVVNNDDQVISFVSDLLQQYNTELYLEGIQYSIFVNDFDNYTTEGFLITERDIQLGSFKPQKQPKQYFNSSDALFRFLPSSNRSRRSKTLTSPDGVAFASREVFRTFRLPSVWQEANANQIMATRIRQSVPEPEILKFTVSFRSILLQPTQFINLLYADDQGGFCAAGSTESQRRYINIPGYIREISYNLRDMTMDLEVWSLGDTFFGDYFPNGPIVGGADSEITFTTAGRAAYISPIANIVSGSGAGLTVEDVDGVNAELRIDPNAGPAWGIGYTVALVDGATHQILETNVVQSLNGSEIIFQNPWTSTISPTVTEDGTIITGGTYLSYATYDIATAEQRANFSYISRPISNYPQTLALEQSELVTGAYDFDDNTGPYIVGDPSLFV